MDFRALFLGSAALVSACGGSDSSSGNQPPVTVPTPSSPPSPTPTPTPSPAYDSFGNPAAAFNVLLSTVLTGYVTDYTVSPAADTPIPTDFRAFGSSISSVTIRPNNGYFFTYNSDEQAFDQTDFRADYKFIGPEFQTFAKFDKATPSGGLRSDFLTIYRPDGGTTGRAFAYTTLGQHITRTHNSRLNSSQTESKGYWFAGGARTQEADVPTTGVKFVIGPAFGTVEKNVPISAVSGTVNIDVDFSKNEINYRLLIRTGRPEGSILEGKTTLYPRRNRFIGTISDENYSGQISGAFNGPKAREVGITFILQSKDGERVAGIAAAVIG